MRPAADYYVWDQAAATIYEVLGKLQLLPAYEQASLDPRNFTARGMAGLEEWRELVEQAATASITSL